MKVTGNSRYSKKIKTSYPLIIFIFYSFCTNLKTVNNCHRFERNEAFKDNIKAKYLN